MRHAVDMRLVVKLFGPQRPKLGEGGIEQFEASVAAEHGDAFLQRIEGFALHANGRVELRLEMEPLGHVVEEVSDAPLRIGIDDDAKRAPIWQIPGLLLRLQRLVGGEEARLPGAEIGLLGQQARRPQPVQNFGIGRPLLEPGLLEAPKLAIGRIVENEALRTIEDDDRGRELIEGARMRLHLARQRIARRLDFGYVDSHPDRRCAGGRIDDVEDATFADDDRRRASAPD